MFKFVKPVLDGSEALFVQDEQFSGAGSPIFGEPFRVLEGADDAGFHAAQGLDQFVFDFSHVSFELVSGKARTARGMFS
jgi:hypothetical protein